MGIVKSSLQSQTATGITLIILLVVALSLVGASTGWPQQSAQPAVDEEFAKQEKIYRSRGSDVPSGYITSRALSDYVALLPSGFCATLTSLGKTDRWLDIGAGAGDAILDYYKRTKCSRPGVKAAAVAMSIEDRRTDVWTKMAASVGENRLRYVSGKPLRYYSSDELGTFQLITDVYGGFTYTEDLSRFVDKVMSLLDINGVFYTMVQGVRLETGTDGPDTAYQTELVDPAGANVNVCSWLKRISCVQVSCESTNEWAPTERINMRKLCSAVSVPALKLLDYQAGVPPGRRFQLLP